MNHEKIELFLYTSESDYSWRNIIKTACMDTGFMVFYGYLPGAFCSRFFVS